MSEGSDSEYPKWATVGCLLYIFIGALWSLGNLFVWMMGPCPAFSSNTICEWSATKRIWLFPGSQLAFVVVGVAIMKVVDKVLKH